MTMFVTRAQWGAKAPTVTQPIGPGVWGCAIHYEGVNLGVYPHAECDDKVRGIQAFHMNTRKWADIAYSAIVCQHGYIYVGRGPGVRTAAQGTDTGNAHYYAVCHLAGPDDPFTDAEKLACIDACNWLSPGTQRKPHSYFHATECPGLERRIWVLAGMPAPHTPQPLPPVLSEKEAEMFMFVVTGGPGTVYLAKITDGGKMARLAPGITGVQRDEARAKGVPYFEISQAQFDGWIAS